MAGFISLPGPIHNVRVQRRSSFTALWLYEKQQDAREASTTDMIPAMESFFGLARIPTSSGSELVTMVKSSLVSSASLVYRHGEASGRSRHVYRTSESLVLHMLELILDRQVVGKEQKTVYTAPLPRSPSPDSPAIPPSGVIQREWIVKHK